MSPLAPALLALAAAAQPVVVPSPSTEVPPPPRSWPSSLVSADDYPAAALRAEEQGRVGYRLTIGIDGRVAECLVVSSSGSAALDAATCRIMRARARFVLARDTAGDPVPDTRAGHIDWVLGDEPPPPPPPPPPEPEPEPVTPYPGPPLPYAPAPPEEPE